MMKNSPLVAVILLALTGTPALSQSLPSTLPPRNHQSYLAPNPKLQGHAWLFQIGDKHYRAKITHGEVEAGPDWKPSKPLPLSISKAEEIAYAELKKLVRDAASWEVTDLQLKRVPGEGQSKWFYVIGMAPREATAQPKHDSFFAVMNLSGVVGKIEEDAAAK